MIKNPFLVLCVVVMTTTSCKTIGEHSESVATDLDGYEQLIVGSLVDIQFANVVEENRWIKLNHDGEVINTLPKDADDRVAVLSSLLAELSAPGVFDGRSETEYQIVIHSMFWEDEATLGGVLVGAHTASAKGAYSLLDGSGKVIRSDTIVTSADSSLGDALSVVGRKHAARVKAVLSNFHKYREILLLNANEVNSSVQ